VNIFHTSLILLLHQEPTNMTLQLHDGQLCGLKSSGVITSQVCFLDAHTALPNSEIPPLSNKPTVVCLDETHQREYVFIALAEGDLRQVSADVRLEFDDLVKSVLV
jgi:hypothetical protein